MSKDGAAEMTPEDDARKFILNSLGVGAMQRQITADTFNKMTNDGDLELRRGADGGVAFLSNVVNAGGLAQGLFIVQNPPSQQAVSFLRDKLNHVAHPRGKTCINLGGETVDMRTFGKSALSNAAGKCITNNCLTDNVQSTPLVLSVDDNSSGDESLQVVRVTPALQVIDPAVAVGKPLKAIDPALEVRWIECKRGQANLLLLVMLKQWSYTRVVFQGQGVILSPPFAVIFQRNSRRTLSLWLRP